MNNFLEFIMRDIDAKKTLLATMPLKTKTNQRNFNEKIDEILEKYDSYKSSLKNYMLAKSESLDIKKANIDVTSLEEEIVNLERVRFLLNPTNTYLEKMGFDNLIYQLDNYYVFKFDSLHDIINGFLDKFALAGINLTKKNFNYTCYVGEYMASFLEGRVNNNYEMVDTTLEKIYWNNSEIIAHVLLNFRELIVKYSKHFKCYIEKIQKEAMVKNNISSYDDVLNRLRNCYNKLSEINKEDIGDIINMAKASLIDMNSYLENNKVRKNAYETLIDASVDLNDQNVMGRVYASLEKLKLNVMEYGSYLEFLPVIKEFSVEYQKMLGGDPKKGEYKGLKDVSDKIVVLSKKLEKINKKIFKGKSFLFGYNDDNELKRLKVEAVNIANEINVLYKDYDKEYFNSKVFKILDNTLTIADLLNLYYSFDYYKKMVIKKVFEVSSYLDLVKYSDKFDLFAMNPMNVITGGVLVFSEIDIASIISNKYIMDNINVSVDELGEDNLETLKNKIDLLLRINVINKSNSSVDKVWFIANVEKMVVKESEK